MDVPLLQTHRDSALALCHQYRAWRQAPWIGQSTLLALERRLHLHLHVLARTDTDAEAPDGAMGPEAAATWLAAGLLSPDAAVRRERARIGFQWLAGEAQERIVVALEVLGRHPGPEVFEALTGTITEAPEALVARLIELHRRWGRDLPPTLAVEDPSLADAAQAARLRWLAERPGSGIEHFRAAFEAESTTVRYEALRGALLQGDGEAACATLQASLGQSVESPLMRLAALSGDARFVPLLRQHAEANPEQGARLLALHGRPQSIEALLDLLEAPRSNAPAAEAWRLCSGQTLPRRPRLQVVGEETAAAAEGEMPLCFDAAAARAAWQQAGGGDGRWLLGRPLSQDAVLAWLQADAGAGAADALDLLALLRGAPSGVVAEQGVRLRARGLAGLADLPVSEAEASHA